MHRRWAVVHDSSRGRDLPRKREASDPPRTFPVGWRVCSDCVRSSDFLRLMGFARRRGVPNEERKVKRHLDGRGVPTRDRELVRHLDGNR